MEHLVLSSFLSSQEVLWLFLFLSFLSLLFYSLLLFGSLLVELHEFGEIKLGLLEELELLNQDVLERENLAALLGNLLANVLLNEFLGQLFQGRFLGFSNHNFHHLFTNSLLLGVLGVTSGSDLLTGSLCESDGEDSQHVSI